MLVGGLAAFLYVNAHGANPEEFEKVEKGMKREEVIGLLGEPDGGSMADGLWTFRYESLTGCHMEIVLDEDGTVLRSAHEH